MRTALTQSTPPSIHPPIHHSFRERGVSDRLYREAFEPMLLVGLFAPGEQCSAAGALGMLYFFILAVRLQFDSTDFLFVLSSHSLTNQSIFTR